MDVLEGGRENAIVKQNDTVTRPTGEHSNTIHRLLTHLHNNGFDACPQFISSDDKTETLTFVEGEVFNYPLKGAIASDHALISAAKLLRRFHDVSESFLRAEVSDQKWMLPVREPVEVVCHGDFAPYNVALQGEHVVGVFDFDCAHPAPRVWDLAYAVYCWAPLKTHQYDKLGSVQEQVRRVALFMKAYGATSQHNTELVCAIKARLYALVSFMQNEAENGNVHFANNIEDGHHLSYLADIDYMDTIGEKIEAALHS